MYGKTLVEPQPLLTEAPKLLGSDRRKMSKSYDNCLTLADEPEAIRKKVISSITDPQRMRREDPGNPDVCLIYDYHKLHSSKELQGRISRECRSAAIGCVEDKEMMVEILNDFLGPIRERREKYLKNPRDLDVIIQEGNKKAQEVAASTMGRVRKAMGLERC